MRPYVSLLLLLILCTKVRVQPRERFELLSETLVTSAYYDLEINGNRLYAASGYGVDIFNIVDRENPQLMQRVATPGIAIEIAVRHNVLYVSDSFRGLYAFDVSDLANINRTWIIEEIDGDPPYCRDLTIRNNRLYASVWTVGVMIFDLDNPQRPEHLATFEASPYPNGVDFQDSLAFINDNAWQSYMVADLRDPNNLIAFNGAGRRLPGMLADIKVHGDLLLLAQSEVGLTIFDISEPLEPRRLEFLNLDGIVQNIFVDGNYAYVSCDVGGLQTIDLSDPNDARVVYVDDTTLHDVRSFDIGYNSTAYAVSQQGELVIYNMINAAEPEPVNQQSASPFISNIASFGETVYSAQNSNGLLILDVSDKRNPRTVTRIDSLNVTSVYRNNNWLYLMTYDQQNDNHYVKSWSLRNPLNPESVWNHRLEEALIGIKVWDELLYLLTNQNQIEVWEISDPDHPDLIAELNDVDFHTFNVRGNYIYGVSSEDRLRIIDIHNLDEPTWLGSSRRMYAGNDVTVHGRAVYVADGVGGIRIFDVSNPIRITEIGHFYTPDQAQEVIVNNGKLWVCDNIGGLHVYSNEHDEGYPKLGFIDTYGYADGAVIMEDAAIVADYFSLAICRYDSTLNIKKEPAENPSNFLIYPAYPNPFNSSVQIDFYLKSDTDVRFQIIDGIGRPIFSSRSLYYTGKHSFGWDATGISSGSYFIDIKLADPVTKTSLGSYMQNLSVIK